MQYIIEMLIYLLAIMGIIFTCISFTEMFYSKKNKKYTRVYHNDKFLDSNVTITLEFFDDEVDEKFVDDFKNYIENNKKKKKKITEILIERNDNIWH